MKSERVLTILILALGVMVWPGQVSEAAPMGTAFTYQGRLVDANEAADGIYDFSFGLYDSANDGNKVGSDVNVPDVDVIDGYFTVELDFNDPNAFTGDARWLEIGVRLGELSDPSPYTTLSPRQRITPTAYALQTRGIFVDDARNVGIGTTTPSEKLEVDGNININSGLMIDGETVLSTGALGIFVGVGAGENETGFYNSAVGYRALYSNTDGISNSAVGCRALKSNTTGGWNTAVGETALYYNTTGTWNNAVGVEALQSNTTGHGNSAVGGGALHNNTTGWYNSAVGYDALHNNTTGYFNSAVGVIALRSNTTGRDNTAVGYAAGWSNSTGSRNVFLGNKAGYYETGDDKLYIANSNTTTPLIYGDFATNRVGIGTPIPDAELEVNGQIKITGGSPGANKVLTSDASGLASWKDPPASGVSIGKVYLTGSGSIISTDGGNRILLWDKANQEIEITNNTGDWCDYWWQSQKGGTTAGGSGAIASTTSNAAIISSTNSNGYGFEVHFGQADGTAGWCSVWLQYANSKLVGHYIKY